MLVSAMSAALAAALLLESGPMPLTPAVTCSLHGHWYPQLLRSDLWALPSGPYKGTCLWLSKAFSLQMAGLQASNVLHALLLCPCWIQFVLLSTAFQLCHHLVCF